MKNCLTFFCILLCYIKVSAQFASNAFAQKISFPCSNGPQGVGVCDLDNDGKKEIIAGNLDGGTLTIYLNKTSVSSINSGSFSSYFLLHTLPNNPAMFSTADFDGNGKQDILLGYALATGNQFSIFLNKYNGSTLDSSSFQRLDFTAGTKPEGLSTGDFDNDGKPDLAIANNISNNLYVFRNTSTPGNISMSAPVIYPLGDAPDASATGDIDNDGKIDIAVANWTSNSITVYKNAFAGSALAFSIVNSVNAYATQNNPYWIKIVDFDNNGTKEIVCSNYYSNSVSIFSDSSSAGISFHPRLDIALSPGQYAAGTAIEDYDNDGRPDLAAISPGSNYISVFKNVHTGGPLTSASFSQKTNFTTNTGPNGAVSADLNNDGRPDLINTNFTADNITIFRNNILAASPTIQSTNFTFSVTSTGTTINFIKGNGAGRIVLARAASPVNLLPKDTDFYNANDTFASGSEIGSGNFVIYADTGSSVTIKGLTPGTLYFFAVMEYNGKAGYSNYLQLNPLIGTNIQTHAFSGKDFAPKVDFIASSGAQAIEVGDLNNDNKNEIMVGNVNGNSVSIYINNTRRGVINDSGFKVFNLPALTFNPGLLSAVDFDKDGKKDILLGYTNTVENKFSIFLNRYNGLVFDSSSFVRHDFTAGTKPEGLSTGDFDGDGKIDIAIANNISEDLYVFRNTSTPGNITMSTPVIYPLGAKPDASAVGDIDNDGKADIAVTNWESNTITVYRNTSTTTGISFTVVNAVATANTQVNPYWVKIVDFDRDGLKDVVCSNWNSASISVFSNTSLAGIVFAPRADISLAPTLYPQGTAIADFDNDGYLDLGVSLSGNDSVSVFRNNRLAGPITTSSFSNKTNYRSGAGPVGAVTNDLDMDLRPDIIVTNFTTGTISILKNRILSDEPSVPATSLVLNPLDSAIALTLTKGSGTKRLILCRENAAVDAMPDDTDFYSASSTFGMGSKVGSGNFVVYNDSGSSMLITGLKPGTTYHLAVFEYNGTGGYSNYYTYSALTGNTSTVGITAYDYLLQHTVVFPNPTSGETNVNFSLPVTSDVEMTTYDIAGREIKSVHPGKMNAGFCTYKLDDSFFGAGGTYFIRLKTGDQSIVKKLIKQ